jgi:hypothetical protein
MDMVGVTPGEYAQAWPLGEVSDYTINDGRFVTTLPARDALVLINEV